MSLGRNVLTFALHSRSTAAKGPIMPREVCLDLCVVYTLVFLGVWQLRHQQLLEYFHTVQAEGGKDHRVETRHLPASRACTTRGVPRRTPLHLPSMRSCRCIRFHRSVRARKESLGGHNKLGNLAYCLDPTPYLPRGSRPATSVSKEGWD